MSVGIVGLAALLAIVASWPAGAAPSPCALDIAIEGTEFEAPVTSTQPGGVTLHGSYTADKPALARAVVTLTGSVSTGWPISISPASITITESVGSTGTFVAVVVAPAGSLHSDVGIVTIVGRMTTGGIQCTDTVDGVSITPRAYLEGISWTATPPESNITGESGSFQLSVQVKANLDVTLTFGYDNSVGWTLTGPSTVPIAANPTGPMNDTVTVEVTVGSAPAGRRMATISIHATAQGGLSNDTTAGVPVNVNSELVGDTFCFSGCVVEEALLVGGLGIAAVAGVIYWVYRRRAV